MADLTKQVPAFEERNARLVVIGNGNSHFIRAFRDETGYHGLLYTDPSLETYKVLQLRSGLGSLMGFKSLKQGIRAMRSGYLQTSIQGDALQQGGAAVIGPGDVLHYRYRNKEAGDHPPTRELLNICDSS